MDFLKKLPIGQYVDGETGWIRNLDSRLKFAWIMMFLITPVLSGPLWRISLVLMLLIITLLSQIPLRVWWRSLLFLAIFSIVLGLLAFFLPTSEIAPALTVRSYNEIPNISLTEKPSWEFLKLGPFFLGKIKLGTLVIDRRSFDLGVKTSTLIFTVIHSVNLMLLTTPPEELMWSLSWFLRPLEKLGVPIEKLSFQLLLALRFLPLVQEELQNLFRALSTRAVSFKKLGFKGSLGIFLALGERFLFNILLRAEQGADALLVRTGGFIVRPNQFQPEANHSRKFLLINLCSALSLAFTLICRQKYGAF